MSGAAVCPDAAASAWMFAKSEVVSSSLARSSGVLSADDSVRRTWLEKNGRLTFAFVDELFQGTFGLKCHV